MLAVYYPDKYRYGTLHLVRSSKQRPAPPPGHLRAKCGQILWKDSTKVNPRSKYEEYIECRRCFPSEVK